MVGLADANLGSDRTWPAHGRLYVMCVVNGAGGRGSAGGSAGGGRGGGSNSVM